MFQEIWRWDLQDLYKSHLWNPELLGQDFLVGTFFFQVNLRYFFCLENFLFWYSWSIVLTKMQESLGKKKISLFLRVHYYFGAVVKYEIKI